MSGTGVSPVGRQHDGSHQVGSSLWTLLLKSNTSGRLYVALVALVVLGAAVGGLICGDGSCNREPPPASDRSPLESKPASIESPYPTLSPIQISIVPTREEFRLILPDYTQLSLADTTSPQSRALDWLVDTDLFFISNTTLNKKKVRFALATLYYATNGSGWRFSTGWLNSSDECEWYYQQTVAGGWCPSGDLFTQLSINENYLSGTIPAEMALLSDLQTLDLYSNSGLKGTIPTELGLLDKLELLTLRSNALTGTIPTELAGMARLTDLYLPANDLTGSIPSELSKMILLKKLDLRSNALMGSIPFELASLSDLQVLDLRENSLTGTIPSGLCNLGLLVDCEMGCICCSSCS
jgi:Leucine Rich Repeat